MEWKELKQIERQLILYDIFRTNDEDTRLSTIRYHLPGINIRTLQRDINDLMDAELIQVYYSRDIGAYINYIDDRDFSCYPEGIQKRIAEKRKETVTKKELSTKKQEHIKRLKRLAELMCSEVYEKADEYFQSILLGLNEEDLKSSIKNKDGIKAYYGLFIFKNLRLKNPKYIASISKHKLFSKKILKKVKFFDIL